MRNAPKRRDDNLEHSLAFALESQNSFHETHTWLPVIYFGARKCASAFVICRALASSCANFESTSNIIDCSSKSHRDSTVAGLWSRASSEVIDLYPRSIPPRTSKGRLSKIIEYSRTKGKPSTWQMFILVSLIKKAKTAETVFDHFIHFLNIAVGFRMTWCKHSAVNLAEVY